MTPPISLEDAWERLFSLARPLVPETVAIDDADGRYLADDLVARRTHPSRDLSAMDGFAIAGPGPWRIVGESRAGVPFTGSLRSGEAAAISTGAACPDGTEAIVPVENAAVMAGTLAARHPAPGHHIRRRGFDFEIGDSLLQGGARVGPAQIALARAAGFSTIEVGARPLVAIIECGDELVGDPEAARPDSIPASNGAMVAAMARRAGAVVDPVGLLPDDRTALREALMGQHSAQVLVTTAGASVGEHDHVRGALEDCGAEIDFWRVAIRPGKPMLVAGLEDRIVLGLPGNPASSYVTAFLFLLPLLRALQGAGSPLPPVLHFPSGLPLPQGGERREFRRARLENGAAYPLPERDSSALRTLGVASLLIDRPAHAPARPAGAAVPCYWIADDGEA